MLMLLTLNLTFQQLWRGVILIAFGLFLTACGFNRGIDEQATFDAAKSGSGLVIIGADIRGDYRDPTLTFRQYDSDSGRVRKESVHVKPKRELSFYQQQLDNIRNMPSAGAFDEGHFYYVFSMAPGNWFISEIHDAYSQNSVKNIANCYLSKGSIAFSLNAGDILYFGEYRLSSLHFNETPKTPA